MALDEQRASLAYRCGRIFAVLERAQEACVRENDPNAKLNATIKDRYFGAAAATPLLVLPRLLVLNRHHLRKLKDSSKFFSTGCSVPSWRRSRSRFRGNWISKNRATSSSAIFISGKISSRARPTKLTGLNRRKQQMSNPVQHRYNFIYLFDVTDGNPNGDPDAGNLPRIDPETSQGLVTDVCLKRKVRNYIADVKNDAEGHKIYVKEKAVLNQQHDQACKALGLKPESKKLPKQEAEAKAITDWMCANFFDMRTFGAVMRIEVNSGQVRGPIQLTFSRSIDPVVSAEFAITRCAVTNDKDLEKERTIGRKFNIPSDYTAAMAS